MSFARGKILPRFFSGRMALFWFAAAIALTLSARHAPAWAQDGGVTPDIEDRPAQEIEALEQEQGAGDASAAIIADGCPAVTFAQILAAPDDIDLNFCYAKQQIGAGDLPGATATIERVLLLRPARADIRLLYAVVLYRLDNLDEAESEFRAVAALPLGGEDRAVIDSYLTRIDKQRQNTTQSVTVSLGGHYDTNRNAAPRGETSLAAGVVTQPANEAARVNDDTGLLGTLRYDVAHKVGATRDHRLLGSMTLYQDDQTERDELDLQSLMIDGAFEYALDNSTKITPRISLSALTLSRQKFYSGYGAHLRIDRQFRLPARAAPLNVFASIGRTREVFRNISENATLVGRDGAKTDAEIGVSRWIAPDHQLSLTLHQSYKTAQELNQSYRFWQGRLQHTWLLGGGRFINSGLSWGARQYRAPDTQVVAAASPQRRRENPVRVRVTYGTPVGVVLDQLGMEASQDGGAKAVIDFMADVTWTVTGEYLAQQSNIRNYEYKNTRVQTLLTKRFEF